MSQIPKRTLLDRLTYFAFNSFFRIFGLVFFRIRTFGSHRYPKQGATLICSNHQSHLDPILVGNSCTSRYLSFVARDSLFKFKPFGRLIRNLGAFPIKRDTGLAGIKETLKRLKNGDAILIFPEGTRTPNGDLQEFKPGFCSLARRTQCPVVPVAIIGAYQAWPRSSPVPRPRQIRVAVGEPLEFEDYRDLSDSDFSSIVENRVRQLLQKHSADSKVVDP